jgi:tRNA C32,U32 (ribose-2'-O)-methylase TrmJ
LGKEAQAKNKLREMHLVFGEEGSGLRNKLVNGELKFCHVLVFPLNRNGI